MKRAPKSRKTIKVTAKNKKDKKYEEIVQILIDHNYDSYNFILDEIHRIRSRVYSLYGIDLPTGLFESILDQFIKLRVGKK